MILKGAQRGGAGQLARHLLNDRDNDHVTLHELRGFLSDDLEGALDEMHAISKATNCRQFMFSLSLNPPKDGRANLEDMIAAADSAEERLGLKEQPRAIVVHEKEGRRHIHVVWSRIEADTMKAVELPFFKNRLASLSKELYLEHGWVLPDGHKENGWKNPLNFTLAEWQQARRLGLDPREVKQVFQQAWHQSDGLRGFRNALEEHGYYLARGDRRGFVAVDLQGEVFSLSRMAGVKTKELGQRLGSPNDLPGVDEVRALNEHHLKGRLKTLLTESQQTQRDQLRPLLEQREDMLAAQRQERAQLKAGQEERAQREREARQARFRKGVRGLLDVVTGRAASIRRENERLALEAFRRDRDQREYMFEAQMKERAALQEKIAETRKEQRSARMLTARRIAFLLELDRGQRAPARTTESRLEPDFP
jgi:hypothetical protein